EARARILAYVRPLEAEPVAVADALDRVLAADVQATGDVPPFPSSAMDGYAVKEGPAGRQLSLVGESRAGAPSDHMLGDDEAVRISTGAAVPAGASPANRSASARSTTQTARCSSRSRGVRARSRPARASFPTSATPPRLPLPTRSITPRS